MSNTLEIYKSKQEQLIKELQLLMTAANKTPDNINWGSIGTIEYYLNQVTELNDNIYKRGEYK